MVERAHDTGQEDLIDIKKLETSERGVGQLTHKKMQLSWKWILWPIASAVALWLFYAIRGRRYARELARRQRREPRPPPAEQPISGILPKTPQTPAGKYCVFFAATGPHQPFFVDTHELVSRLERHNQPVPHCVAYDAHFPPNRVVWKGDDLLMRKPPRWEKKSYGAGGGGVVV